jgi:predicted transcriptional regulator of viral defense system
LTIAEYIHQLQSIEEYAFSWKELLSSCGKTETSLKSELSRLVAKRKILNLRKGFYLIIPPRYSNLGQIPVQLYIQKLFKTLGRNYYLGFYSAAKFHGASHQQIQQEYVMTEYPKLGDIKKKELKLRFFTTSKWPNKNIQDKKSDGGFFKISSPALTAVDLIHHQTKLGGINRMISVLKELLEEISPKDISELLTWYPHKSTLQRFGFLLEELRADQGLTTPIWEHVKSSEHYPVLLTPKSGQKPGSIGNEWKVDINIKIESDI